MSDLYDVRGGTFCTNKAGLGGLTAGITTYTTTAPGADDGLNFAIAGKAYRVADKTATATPTVDITTGDAFVALTGTTAATGTGCVFVFCFDSGGTLRVAQGPIVSTVDVANGSAAYEFPAIPASVCPFAYVTVSYIGATSWIFGTSNWDATTTVLGTAIDCLLLPTQPLTAASA